MSEPVLQAVSQPEARRAVARSRAYATFARLFDYPDGELFEDVRDGTLAEALRSVLAEVDPALAASGSWEALREAGAEPDDLAVEYTRLFDVGSSGPPCPLYGGLYGGARMKTMEEAVRFYNHFGLSMAESPRELPDHIMTQLEFLHFLAFRAQRDFVSRHPGRWVPRLRERLDQNDPMPFFRELVARLGDFLAHDARHLVALAGAAPAER
jgi:DMSO reductase family type II enzyme chaperone